MVGLLARLSGITTKPQSGSHVLFVVANAPKIVNIQAQNGKCKTYQVRQVRDLIARHGLDIAGGKE